VKVARTVLRGRGRSNASPLPDPAAMVAIAIATFIVGKRTIYRSQLVSRADVDWAAIRGPQRRGAIHSGA
jgi:hypothetical protein